MTGAIHPKMDTYDLGLRCDYLLTMANGSGKVLRDYFLGVNGSNISVVAPWKENTWKCERFIHASNKIVMPGLINSHTHLAMSLFRGLADDLPFEQWLHKFILPLEAKLVDSEFVKTGTELSVLECIRSGVTTVCDMYFFADQVAQVIEESGMRGFISEAITDFSGPLSFEILERLVERYKYHERIRPSIGPHAPYTCSDKTIQLVKAFADKNQLPIIMHVAETKNEVDESLKKFSKTPIKRLSDLGILRKNTILAHCVHLHDEDIELLHGTKTSVIYNPESNMKLGSGAAPIPKLLKRGVCVGIGTDGAASNNDLNIFGEMDTGAKLQKLVNSDNTALTALDMLKMATIDGARALNLDDKIGSLEVGKFADLISIDLNSPNLMPIHNLTSQLVYATSGAEVDFVMCHGRILMENREIKNMDEGRILKDVQRFCTKIQAELS